MPVAPTPFDIRLIPNRNPYRGTPAGFINVVVACESFIEDDTVVLMSTDLVQFSNQYYDQVVFGAIADADPSSGPLLANVNGIGILPIFKESTQAGQADIAVGDYFQLCLDMALGSDGGFHLLNWSQLGSGGGGSGTTLIVTDAGTVTVPAGTRYVILNKAVPSDTPINLPSVNDQGSIPITVSDFAGTAQTITLNPDGSETIMGANEMELISNGAGPGLAASGTISPNTTVEGWFVS